MCNVTRLIVESLHDNFILAEIVSECNKGYKIMIPRIKLQPSNTNLPFILSRCQFPIIPECAMTIKKAQGQSFEYVGILLNEAVFAHGQLYVALSRSKNPHNIKIFTRDNHMQGKKFNVNMTVTQNIVYPEVFS